MNLADEQLKAVLETLPLRERRAIEMNAAGLSLEEIAARLKVSRSTAHRLITSANQKLKAAARAAKWRNVLAGGMALDTSRADDEAKPGELEEAERNQ